MWSDCGVPRARTGSGTRGVAHRREAVAVAAGDIPLLASGVPDLRLDRLALSDDRFGGELDADGALRLEIELVAGEA